MKSLAVRTAAVVLAVATALPAHAEFLTLTRSPMIESKLPTNISTITADDIRESGAVNVADALQVLPGVDPQRSGSIGTLTSARIRGVPGSNSVQVIIDDQPVGGVSIQDINLALIPTENVERIEIVRGASSMLYGPNTTGGVIHIITKKNHGTPSVEMGAEVQSFQTQIYRLGASGSYGPHSIGVNGQAYTTDGYIRNSDVSSQSGSASYGFKFANGGNVHLASDYTTIYGGTPNGTPTKYENWNGHEERIPNSEIQQIDNEMWRSRVSFDTPVMSHGLLKATVFHQKEHHDFYEKPTGFFDSQFWNTVVGGDVRVITDIGLTVGTSYERDERESTGQAPNDVEDVGVYVEQELNVGQLTLLPAVRFDDHTAFGSEVNPRLTAVYRVTDQWKFSTSAARSVRAPTLVNLYGAFPDPTPAFSFFGNPDLNPEKAMAYDLGTQWAPSWGSLGVTGFFTKIEDRINSVDSDGNTTLDTLGNLGTAEISGVELEARLVAGHFSHEGAYTYQRAVGSSAAGTDYVELRLTPHHTASYRLNWEPGARFKLTNTVEYVSAQYQNDDRAPVSLFDPVTFAISSDLGKLPPYATWNVRAEQGFKWGAVYAGVNNVLSRLYAESLTFNLPTPQPTRTLIAGASLKFGGEAGR